MRPPTSTARRAATGLRSALAEPILALAAVARRIPGPLRRPVGRVLLSATRTRGRTAPIRMLALDLVGRRGEALGLADDRAADAATRPAVRLALARASLALRSPAGAERLIRNLPDESANRPVSMTLRAEVALLRGRLTEARDLARQAVGLDPRAAGVADRAERELRALTPGWRPIVARRGRLGAAVPGRVVHLLTNSLPWVTAGYTLRSHEIGRAQLAAGLEPHLATRAGFPRAFGVRGAPAADEIDGVTYHRLAPDLEPASAPDQFA